MNQSNLFEDVRMKLPEAMELTIASLKAYGLKYRHWTCAFSGGKDSTATVTMVAYLIEHGLIPEPESLTVLYADTRQELPPLHLSAMKILDELSARGIRTEVVLPPMDKRYFVYILGRGVPPPNNNTLRWCTRQIKIDPMIAALRSLRDSIGEKFLMLTGVRLGESAARDQRIALSCSGDQRHRESDCLVEKEKAAPLIIPQQ
jgi:DNA sulfur modification protein DndC